MTLTKIGLYYNKNKSTIEHKENTDKAIEMPVNGFRQLCSLFKITERFCGFHKLPRSCYRRAEGTLTVADIGQFKIDVSELFQNRNTPLIFSIS